MCIWTENGEIIMNNPCDIFTPRYLFTTFSKLECYDIGACRSVSTKWRDAADPIFWERFDSYIPQSMKHKDRAWLQTHTMLLGTVASCEKYATAFFDSIKTHQSGTLTLHAIQFPQGRMTVGMSMGNGKNIEHRSVDCEQLVIYSGPIRDPGYPFSHGENKPS